MSRPPLLREEGSVWPEKVCQKTKKRGRGSVVLIELVFFPTNIADRAGPPTFGPMSDVGYRMFRTAAQALWLWRNFKILDFSLRHS